MAQGHLTTGWIAAAAILLGASAAAGEGFVRTSDARLQTAEVVLRHASGVRVTLLAMIHVAEPRYFDAIGRDLDRFDAVIHEGAAAPATSGPGRDPATAAVPEGLVRQARQLRFTGDRFVPADARPGELARLLTGQPTGITTRSALAAAACGIDADPLWRERADRAYAIRPRNAIALEAVGHRLARGDRSVALVYGAAHARDLQERLQALGFVVQSRAWRDAFRIE